MRQRLRPLYPYNNQVPEAAQVAAKGRCQTSSATKALSFWAALLCIDPVNVAGFELEFLEYLLLPLSENRWCNFRRPALRDSR